MSTPESRPPNLGFAVLYGAVSLGVVSVLAYSIWAFKLVHGQAAMYSSIAAVYLLLGGLALSRLVSDPAARRKFPLWFALAFLIYALAWCALWFGLKGKMLADLWGALAGLAAMAALWQRLFAARGEFLRVYAGLFVLHSAGYYLGGQLHLMFSGPPGMLLWGAAHGVGFGAGIGYVLWRCQSASKLRLPSSVPA